MNQITKKLTDKQTALVDTLVANGCSIKQAAGLAGYADGESGRVTASKALKLAHVQQYMMRRMNEEFSVSATLAASTVRRLAGGAKIGRAHV